MMILMKADPAPPTSASYDATQHGSAQPGRITGTTEPCAIPPFGTRPVCSIVDPIRTGEPWPRRYYRFARSGLNEGVRVVERHVEIKGRVVTREAIKRFAARSTKASAQLERRVLPAGYVRSPKVERFLAERRPQV